MKFFERDLCERLVELGCVGDGVDLNRKPLFGLYHFIAPTNQARKNSYIVGKIHRGGGKFFVSSVPDEEDLRYVLVLCDSELEAEQMIRKAVGL